MKLYEWQLTAYMHLKMLIRLRLAFIALVDTPSRLVSRS